MLTTLREAQPAWEDLIAASFLPPPFQEAYRGLVRQRRVRLFGAEG